MALTEKLTAIADAIRTQSGRTDLLTLDQMPSEIIDLQSLNFEVAGNPQPANPKENTIWVDTDAEITGWVFAAQQPETATEGMVWFSTGTSGSGAFNALKENTLVVYPMSAKQYIDGAWVSKSAKIYKNGAWALWATFIYQVGVGDSGALTGGWGYATTRATSASVTPSASQFKLAVYCDDSTGFIYPYTKNVIDFSKYSKLAIQVESMTNVRAFKFGVSSSTSNSDSYSASKSVAAIGTYYCDISGITGALRVRMTLECVSKTSANVVISEIWLEE